MKDEPILVLNFYTCITFTESPGQNILFVCYDGVSIANALLQLYKLLPLYLMQITCTNKPLRVYYQ